MTSRPAAAAAPSPMTVSSMVRPLAVVIVDMGLLVVENWSEAENAFRRRTGRAGVEAVVQRSGSDNVRERAGIGHKYPRRSQGPPGQRSSAAIRRLEQSAPSHCRNI